MLKTLQISALIEAISAILLFFVAMPLKYIFHNDTIMRPVGMAHGVLWIIFVVLLIACWSTYKWSFKKFVKYFIFGTLPVLSFWVEKDLKRELNAQKEAA
ncbi:DUF3817 domain-containing protein [Sphingobacterium lactis]|uniref:DUF3817 domain-containing protein n=1 Tax=Sphingobacterium lactis TaxID=797291 RepID=UPI003F7F5771